jgi:6-phosphogluconolactonase
VATLKNQQKNESFLNPSKTDIQIVDTEALSTTAATVLFHYIRETLEVKDFFTLVLSGGSTPRNTFALLASDESFRAQIPWDRIHFFWGDERHVPPDHEESNYRMANEVMLSRVPVPEKNIHRIKSENPDSGNAAAQYEEELNKFFNLKRGQFPRFDCILLGMGADGHTASLFPGTEALHEESRLVSATWVEQLQTYRITLTLPVLNNADLIMFIVSGNEKAEILTEVIEGKKQPTSLPAQLIEPNHGRLLWLLDKGAASQLNLYK